MGRQRTGQLRIVSRISERFRDRRDAGRALAAELAYLRDRKPVVLGIPRGGILVAEQVAMSLDADLDIVLARKLRAPGYPELALGSVAEDGTVFLNDRVVRELNVSQSYIRQEKERQLQEMSRRIELIRRVLPKVSLDGRVVIVTDDGVATGATFQASLWATRQGKPSLLVGAIPVGAEETVIDLAHDADDLVCLRVPPFFAAVGQFYVRFEQVEDTEVLEILRAENERRRERNRST